MKFIGAGLIWTSLIYAGAAYSIKLNKHIVILEKTVMMLEEIKVQMEFLNLPVYELIRVVGSKKYLYELTFLKVCHEMIVEGSDFPYAWTQSVENSDLYYKREEKDKLLHLGANLGRSDRENQINLLNVHILHFRNSLDKAKLQKQKHGSLSVALGVLTGCVIFIMII